MQFRSVRRESRSSFFVLGILNEYNGRGFLEGSDRLESFYCNEAKIAGLFKRTADALAREQRLEPDIREEIVQGCLTDYYSRTLAPRVDSCYRYSLTREIQAETPDGQLRRTASASLGGELFTPPGAISGTRTARGLSDDLFLRRRALAYLAGAWARYGRGRDFVFSNARSKVDLIARLLVDLGCTNMRVESTVGLIPQGNAVHFEPTAEVTEWLQWSW